MFQKQYLFPFSGKKGREASTLMGLLGRLILIICDSPVTLNTGEKLLSILEKLHTHMQT